MLSKYQFKPKFSLVLKLLVHLTFLLILILPYSESFFPIGTEERWIKHYILLDLEFILLYFPLILVWILSTTLKSRDLRRVFKILALLGAFFISGTSFISLSIAVQDFMPSYGILLSVLLFPLVLLYYSFDKLKERKNRNIKDASTNLIS